MRGRLGANNLRTVFSLILVFEREEEKRGEGIIVMQWEVNVKIAQKENEDSHLLEYNPVEIIVFLVFFKLISCYSCS